MASSWLDWAERSDLRLEAWAKSDWAVLCLERRSAWSRVSVSCRPRIWVVTLDAPEMLSIAALKSLALSTAVMTVLPETLS